MGIETSCDETAVAIVDSDYKVRSQIVTRQIVHEKWGGVVPESASRAHLELIDESTSIAVQQSKLNPSDIDAIAVTIGPGLAGALWIGTSFAQGIALALKKPWLPVHHLEAHLWSVKLVQPHLTSPFLALLVSGGHTLLIHVNGYREYSVIGKTRDDSIGEAFDKAARMLKLGYPGGPAIENASKGLSSKQHFKLPITDIPNSYDFSFSGLKTALKNAIENHSEISSTEWAIAFQYAAVTSLLKPLQRYWKIHPQLPLVLTGGVASNELLRKYIFEFAIENKLKTYATPKEYCTDNAVMIAVAGIEMLKHKSDAKTIQVSIKPKWNLEELV